MSVPVQGSSRPTGGRLASGLVLVFLLTTSGCGTVAAVRALHKGESAVAVSLGGPVANVAGMDIPMPYAVGRYRYGLTDRAGLFGGAHLAMPAFGVLGLEAGLSYQFLDQRGALPGLSASAGFTGLLKLGGEEAFFPGLDFVASWKLGASWLVYGGVQSMFQLNEKPNVVFAPLVGAERRFGRWRVALESKWYAPTEVTHPRNVNYRLPIGGHGAVGFVVGVSYDFGPRR